MDKIKVIIADDSDFVRDGLNIILNIDDEFDVIGCAASGKEAVNLVIKNKTEVILMDIQMPEMSGIEATKEIVSRELGKVLILTTFDDYDLVKQAIINGAKGYIMKNHTPDKLKQMIKSIYSGVNVLDEKVFNKFTESLNGCSSNFDETLFTSRELEIIKLVADGLSNKDIAANLFISEGTVKNHVSTILEKGGLSHRTQLAVYYLTGKK